MTTPTSLDHRPPSDPAAPALLELRDVSKTFRAGGWSQARRHPVRAVSGVSLTVHTGEAGGLIG